jgi:uncharacterized metal-binding protein YceD (DUF177 family)
MTPESVGPLSRPISVENLPAEGVSVTVDATPEERAALAKDFKLPAIRALTGAFRVTGSASGVHVAGRVAAEISQICVVTLDPFDSTVEEEVDVDFAATGRTHVAVGEEDRGYDPPDEITGGHVDLGALTAEFLALGLDPHPRKPGVDFSYEAKEDGSQSPFAALKALKER